MKYLLTIILLSGCASFPAGLEITDDERAACEAEGCSVWTQSELEKLVRAAMLRGYQAGRKSL